MSEKKYQVFLSSTYTDLLEERQAAINAVLDAGHIPTGMELFVAEDRHQWDVITKWIDECDIYMLVLGGRYGSIEPKSGKSYTHLEFEYALAQGKPFFALCLNEKAIDDKVAKLGAKNVIEQVDTRALNAFRKQVDEQMRMTVEDLKDIEHQTRRSLDLLTKRPSLVGWVRATSVIQSEDDAKAYGIRITLPKDRDTVGECDFHGTIARPLPEGYEIRLIRSWPQLRGGYYPLGDEVEVDIANNCWVVRNCEIYGDKGHLRVVSACIMDRAGVTLSNYYAAAAHTHWQFVSTIRGQLNDSTLGGPLPPIQKQHGTFICHTIHLTHN